MQNVTLLAKKTEKIPGLPKVISAQGLMARDHRDALAITDMHFTHIGHRAYVRQFVVVKNSYLSRVISGVRGRPGFLVLVVFRSFFVLSAALSAPPRTVLVQRQGLTVSRLKDRE
jgi:hypothetical protein